MSLNLLGIDLSLPTQRVIGVQHGILPLRLLSSSTVEILKRSMGCAGAMATKVLIKTA